MLDIAKSLILPDLRRLQDSSLAASLVHVFPSRRSTFGFKQRMIDMVSRICQANKIRRKMRLSTLVAIKVMVQQGYQLSHANLIKFQQFKQQCKEQADKLIEPQNYSEYQEYETEVVRFFLLRYDQYTHSYLEALQKISLQIQSRVNKNGSITYSHQIIIRKFRKRLKEQLRKQAQIRKQLSLKRKLPLSEQKSEVDLSPKGEKRVKMQARINNVRKRRERFQKQQHENMQAAVEKVNQLSNKNQAVSIKLKEGLQKKLRRAGQSKQKILKEYTTRVKENVQNQLAQFRRRKSRLDAEFEFQRRRLQQKVQFRYRQTVLLKKNSLTTQLSQQRKSFLKEIERARSQQIITQLVKQQIRLRGKLENRPKAKEQKEMSEEASMRQPQPMPAVVKLQRQQPKRLLTQYSEFARKKPRQSEVSSPRNAEPQPEKMRKTLCSLQRKQKVYAQFRQSQRLLELLRQKRNYNRCQK